MDGKLESGRFKNSLSTWSAQIYPVAKFITRQNFPRTTERERESHVARNFFLNRLSNIPFHVSSASFLTPRFSSDGRANVKQWKIFERSLPSSRFLPIFARELNNVFFSPFLLSLSLFFSFLLYANEFRSTGVGRQRTPSRKFQRVQTSDFSEGGYVVRAQGLDSEVTGKSEASMPNEGLSAPQGALAQRRYTAAPSQRPQDST